jgi:hypothetical protein
MARRKRLERLRIADVAGMAADAARARRSARLARAGAWVAVTPEDAEAYAVRRLDDAQTIEDVYTTPANRDPGDGPSPAPESHA